MSAIGNVPSAGPVVKILVDELAELRDLISQRQRRTMTVIDAIDAVSRVEIEKRDGVLKMVVYTKPEFAKRHSNDDVLKSVGLLTRKIGFPAMQKIAEPESMPATQPGNAAPVRNLMAVEVLPVSGKLAVKVTFNSSNSNQGVAATAKRVGPNNILVYLREVSSNGAPGATVMGVKTVQLVLGLPWQPGKHVVVKNGDAVVNTLVTGPLHQTRA